MSNEPKRFKRGITLVPYDSGPNAACTDPTCNIEGHIYSYNNKIKAYVQSAVREMVTTDQTQTLTNKTIGDCNTINAQDDAFAVQDSADATKQVNFDVGCATTCTTTTVKSSQTANRTVTLPDATDTLVGKATTDTLTNKTLTAPTITGCVTASCATITGATLNCATICSPTIIGTFDFEDDELTISDTTDNTKKVQFDVTGTTCVTGTVQTAFTTAKTVTLPDATDTLVGKATTDTLTNKTIGDCNTINAQDDAFTIQDAADSTKRIDFDAAGTTGTKTTITSSQTTDKIITIPDATDTLVGRNTTDTLTNKTLNECCNTIVVSVSGLSDTTITCLADGESLTWCATCSVWVNTDIATQAELTCHICSTAAHGATGQVVGTTNTQTLTNKTLTSPVINTPNVCGGTASNSSRIVLPKATTAALCCLTNTQASVAYDTCQNAVVFNDGCQWTAVGTGGGGGLSVFHTETFETTVAACASTGNNATFLGGGFIVGTLADETIAPISGCSSIKYTSTACAACDYVAFPAVTLDLKEKDQFIGIDFYTTYTGNDNEIDFIVWDTTNSSVLVRVPIEASCVPLKHSAYFNSASTTASIRYGFQVQTGNASAVLKLDDIEAAVDPLTPTDIYASSEPESWTPTLAGFGTPSNLSAIYWRNGKYLEGEISLTAGTVTATTSSFSLPSGLNIDSTKVSDLMTNLGWGNVTASTTIDIASGSSNSDIVAFPDTSTSTSVVYLTSNLNTNASGDVYVKENTNAFVGSGANVSITFRVPIAGWSNTSQGVVVENRSDSASVENEFSAVLSIAGATTSDPTIDSQSITWLDSATFASDRRYNIDYSGLGLTVAPKINASISVDSGTVYTVEPVSVTTSTAQLLINPCDNFNYKLHIELTKQGSDYIKETDKVYTVPVDTLTGNYVRAEGNGGTSITANVTDIDFTEVTDTASAWDGDSYTVQKNNSIITLTTNIFLTTSANTVIQLYKNGTAYKYLNYINSSTTIHGNATYRSARGEFAEGDTISIRMDQSSTLSNNTQIHYLNITEEYGDRGTFLGTFGLERQYLRLEGGAGTGSTDTQVRTFDTQLETEGSDLFTHNHGSYGTAGLEITFTKKCKVTITYSDYAATGSNRIGISKNGSGTTALTSLSSGQLLANTSIDRTTTHDAETITWSGKVQAGDVLRPHVETAANLENSSLSILIGFTVTAESY